MAEKKRKKQSLLNGALILFIASAFAEIVGVLYKIPLTDIIGAVGRGYTGTAYNIYIPIYNIAMSGLPVAISKLVSESAANGNFKDVKKIFKVAFRLFFVIGAVGTAVLFALAYPYAKSIDSIQSLPSILMIAPAVFFCSLMSTYRGYYSGLRNQNPHAISQMVEVLGKVAFGLSLSYLVQKIAMQEFSAGNPVFGVVCKTKEEAISAMTPYAAAASIFGVTMGAVCSLIYLVIRDKIAGDKITKEEIASSPEPRNSKQLRKLLISIAVPVVVSSIVMNISNLIDSWSIQFRLQSAINSNLGVIENMFSSAISNEAAMSLTELKSYIYGAYEIALDFRNLVPSVMTSLGLSAIPVLSEAWAMKNKRTITSSIESVTRTNMIISLPAGIGMAVLARPILDLVYGVRPSNAISAPVMAYYGLFTFIMAFGTPVINMLQGIGRQDIPMKTVSAAAIVKVAVNFILVGIPSINIYGAIIGTFLFYFISLSLNLYYLIKITNVKMDLFSVFIKPLFCSLICGASAWGFNGLLSDYIPSFGEGRRFSTSSVSCIVAILISIVIYALALLFTKAIAKEDLEMLPGGKKLSPVLERHNLLG